VISSHGSWGAAFASRAARPQETMHDIAKTVATLSGWRRHAVAFAAGVVSVLAMAPFSFWPVLFVSLPVLVWMIDGSARPQAASRVSFWQRPVVRAATAGWWFGFGYFLLGLYWIGIAFLVEAEKFAWLMPFAVTMMPAGLALFFGLATGAACLVWPKDMSRVLVLALALGATEWLRGHVLTGFPWNTLGYALTSPLEFMQAASVVGIYGLTLLAVAIFASPLVLIADAGAQMRAPRERKHALIWAGVIAAVPLLALYTFGAWRLAGPPAPMLDGVRIRVVQASVDQRDKWKADKQGPIFSDQIELSRHDAQGRRDDLAGITHLIWPEAAMPFLPLEHPEALSAIGELLPDGTKLISGALRLKKPASTKANGSLEGFNSLMVFDAQGGLAGVYDKIHLVPFGEYLPFQATLEWIGLEQLTRWRGGFRTGANPRPLLAIGGLPPVAGLICYEAIFPAAIVQGATRPGLLVNVTNDGWFGDTTGPWQHFQQSRVRAVEEGLPLVRSANNGVSAVVDAKGRIDSMLTLNARGVIDSGIPASIEPPLYAKFGDWTFVALALCFVVAATVLVRRQRN
jgi:apolipoprotein N-acyltransferase